MQKKVKEFYQRKLDELLLKKDELADPKSFSLQNMIKDSNEIFSEIKTTSLAVDDSLFLTQSSVIGKIKTHNLTKTAIDFTPEDFTSLFCQFLEDKLKTDVDYGEDNKPIIHSYSIDIKELSKMSMKNTNSVITNITNPFQSVFVQTNKKQALVQEKEIQKEHCPIKREENIREEENSTKRIRKLYETLSKKKTVPLFQFIIDPNSFSKTVENLFHISFLIKEEKAVLIENEEKENNLLKTELTIIESDLKNKRPIEEMEEQHKILSITKEEWESIKTMMK